MLVHAVQIQGMLGGGRIPGSWTAYYILHFLGCWTIRGSECVNELEKEAYIYANGGNCVPGKLRHYVDTMLIPQLPLSRPPSLPPCKCAPRRGRPSP